MEQHAVPQDITGFKFKLVGDMTLKQFGELAGGATLAYLFYASNWPFFLKWPLVAIFALLGLALAFLPVEERPLDVWIINFIKAIYQPTLYIWKKGLVPRPAMVDPTNVTTFVGQPAPATAPQLWPYPKEPEPTPRPAFSPPPALPASEPSRPEPTAGKPPLSIEDLQQLRDRKAQEIEEAAHPPKPVVPPPKGPEFLTVDTLALRRDEKKITDRQKLAELVTQNESLVAQIKAVQTKILSLSGSDTTQFQNQLQELEKQRGAITSQIAQIQGELEGKNEQVRIVDKPTAKATNLQLTDVPNIVNGVVTSDKGSPLDATILIIKDKNGNSIRAFKTNQVGQFMASTPLENGTYYLEFERAGFTFDTLEINLTGEVVPPLRITAKTANGDS